MRYSGGVLLAIALFCSAADAANWRHATVGKAANGATATVHVDESSIVRSGLKATAQVQWILKQPVHHVDRVLTLTEIDCAKGAYQIRRAENYSGYELLGDPVEAVIPNSAGPGLLSGVCLARWDFSAQDDPYPMVKMAFERDAASPAAAPPTARVPAEWERKMASCIFEMSRAGASEIVAMASDWRKDDGDLFITIMNNGANKCLPVGSSMDIPMLVGELKTLLSSNEVSVGVK